MNWLGLTLLRVARQKSAKEEVDERRKSFSWKREEIYGKS